MKESPWVNEFPAAITVCNESGVILEMNDRSRTTFADDGGGALVGKSLLDCHAGTAREKVIELLETKTLNCYTIEKKGVKKLIYQSPWYEGGKYRGFIEISLPIPERIPHFQRD